MMFKYAILVVVLYTQLLAKYDIGDTISNDDKIQEFPYCYPSNAVGTFSFNKLAGKVLMLEMSASW